MSPIGTLKSNAASSEMLDSQERRATWQLSFPRVRCYLVNGALILWGVVGSDAIRLQAEETAWRDFAADSIVNQIQIE